jgi:hypothetical protein
VQDIDPVNLEEDPELDRLIEFWVKNRQQLAFMLNVDYLELTDKGLLGHKVVMKKGQPVHLVLTRDQMPAFKT